MKEILGSRFHGALAIVIGPCKCVQETREIGDRNTLNKVLWWGRNREGKCIEIPSLMVPQGVNPLILVLEMERTFDVATQSTLR